MILLCFEGSVNKYSCLRKQEISRLFSKFKAFYREEVGLGHVFVTFLSVIKQGHRKTESILVLSGFKKEGKPA